MPGLPLSQAINEYLAWLELDRHALTGTMTGYRGDLRRFSDFVGGDAGIPNIADLDRDILHGYQRHLARVRTGPKAARRPLAISTRSQPIGGVCAASCASPPARSGYLATSGCAEAARTTPEAARGARPKSAS
jgi:hypothetical protein